MLAVTAWEQTNSKGQPTVCNGVSGNRHITVKPLRKKHNKVIFTAHCATQVIEPDTIVLMLI